MRVSGIIINDNDHHHQQQTTHTVHMDQISNKRQGQGDRQEEIEERE